MKSASAAAAAAADESAEAEQRKVVRAHDEPPYIKRAFPNVLDVRPGPPRAPASPSALLQVMAPIQAAPSWTLLLAGPGATGKLTA